MLQSQSRILRRLNRRTQPYDLDRIRPNATARRAPASRHLPNHRTPQRRDGEMRYEPVAKLERQLQYARAHVRQLVRRQYMLRFKENWLCVHDHMPKCSQRVHVVR